MYIYWKYICKTCPSYGPFVCEFLIQHAKHPNYRSLPTHTVIPPVTYPWHWILTQDSLDLFNFGNNIKIMGKKAAYIARVVWTRYIQRLEDLNEASEAVDVTCSDGVQPKTIVLCPWFEEDNRWFSAYLTQKSSFAAAFYVYISMHAISIRITYLSHILHSDER